MIPVEVKKTLSKIIPCMISFFILVYFCVKDNNLLTLISVFPRLNFLYFGLAVCSIFVYWFTDALVFKELLPEYCNKISGYIKLTMYGQFYGAITPFSSGGQVSQTLLLGSHGIEAGKSISVLSQKFFISQLCTVLVSSASIFFKSGKFKDNIPGFVVLTLVGLAVQCSGILAIVLFYWNKRKVMDSVHMALNFAYRLKILKNPKQISENIEKKLTFLMNNNFSINCRFRTYIYCMMQNLFFCFVSFFIAKSFGCQGFPLIDFIAAQTFINLLSIANPLPGSAGTAEGSFLLLYRPFFSENNISSAMILFRLINYYLGMILGFFVVLLNKNYKNHD